MYDESWPTAPGQSLGQASVPLKTGGQTMTIATRTRSLTSSPFGVGAVWSVDTCSQLRENGSRVSCGLSQPSTMIYPRHVAAALRGQPDVIA